MSTLTGAAEDSVARSALHKRAKRRIADRDTLAPADVEALLRSVYALTPANRRRKLDEEGAGEWTPKEGPAAWLAEQREDVPVDRELLGWALPLLAEAMARPINLDVFTGALLGNDEDPCGCLNNPLRWETDPLAGDPSGCYCECIDDGNDDCVHGPDVVIPAFFDLNPEPPTSVYYTGHGIGHQYRPDVAR